MEILAELESIFKNIFLKKEISLSNSTTANDIEGWDSLTHLELITEIENHYKIRFSFHEVVSFQNVGDIIEQIKRHTRANKN